MLPWEPLLGCLSRPSAAAFGRCHASGARAKTRIAHFLLLSLPASVLSRPWKDFAEAVLLSMVEQNSDANSRGGPGVLIIQDKPLESAPWLGTQKSLCWPDVLWPPRQIASRKLLEDINVVVTELGRARWFWSGIVKIWVGWLALTFKSLRWPWFLSCIPPQTQSTEAGLSGGRGCPVPEKSTAASPGLGGCGLGWSVCGDPGMWLESSQYNQEPLPPLLLAQALLWSCR